MGLVLVSIIWGTGFVATKIALEGYQPLTFMAIRFIVATAIVGIIFRKDLAKVTKSDMKGGIVIGSLLFAGFVTQTIGLLYTTPAKQAFITGTNVVFVPFIYWAVTKVKPDFRALVGAIVCLMGIGLLSINESFTIGIGDALTFLCAIFFAGQIVAIGHFAKDTQVNNLLVIQLATVALLSLGSAMVFEDVPSTIHMGALAATMYTAIFGTCVAFFIQNVAQKHTSSSQAAIILSMEAVFGSLSSALIIGEHFTMKMVIGSLSILAAIIITELKPVKGDVVQPE